MTTTRARLPLVEGYQSTKRIYNLYHMCAELEGNCMVAYMYMYLAIALSARSLAHMSRLIVAFIACLHWFPMAASLLGS